MEKGYIIIKLAEKHNRFDITYDFKKVSKPYSTYDKALDELNVMSDDGIFIITECYIKENGR